MLEMSAWIVTAVLLLATVALVASWRALAKLRSAPVEVGDALPPIVVVRPIRGRDPGLEANVEAALAQRYPGPMETIFVLDHERDPAYPVVRRLVEGHPNARVVLAGPRRLARTGKLHAMIEGMEAARLDAPLVCFADSDTRPHATLIAELARAVVREPDVGSAFAPAVSVAPPRTAGDVGYGLLLDGLYGPQAALVMVQDRTLPFIMGQTMVLRRSALDAAGGLRASTGQLVDDMHIGAGIARAGFRNVLVGTPLPIWSEGMSWPAFRSLALRWMIYGRTGIPMWPFNALTMAFIGAFYVAALAALTALAAGELVAAATFASAALLGPAAVQGLRRRQGAAPVPLRLLWALPLALALAPIVFFQGRFARTVDWRGRRYPLDAAGRLEVGPDPTATSTSNLRISSLPQELRR